MATGLLHGYRGAETGVVAVLRTETETAAGTERPGGRDQLAACSALRWMGF